MAAPPDPGRSTGGSASAAVRQVRRTVRVVTTPLVAARQVTADLLGPVPAGPVAPATAPRRVWARLRGPRTIPGLRTTKVAATTALAYLLAELALRAQPPVVAALTALLVVQLTPYQTLRTGWQRVSSVVAGVLLAVLLSAVIGLTWWVLGLTVLAALVIGHALRLGEQASEVAISAMLVLAVGTHTEVGWSRVVETLIGAAVGIAVSLLTQRTYLQPAGDAIGQLATRIGDLLRSTADDLDRDWSVEHAARALQRARDLEPAVARARTALTRAEESVRLSPKRRRTAHVPPSLKSGLTALEYAWINTRVICRALVDRVAAGRDRPGPALSRPVAALLRATADAVTEFGDLVAAEVEGPARDDARLRWALHEAGRRRDAASTALHVDPVRDPASWRVHGALLAHVDRLLSEIDPRSDAAGRAVARTRRADTTDPRMLKLSASALRRGVRRVRPSRSSQR